MFITFEAGEGAGKSTQAKRLVATLRDAGFDVVHTREPGGSPLAEELRSFVVQGEPDRMDAVTELLIFTAARRDHIKRTIQPALDAGRIVVCDRYLGSTHALQGAAGVPANVIDDLHETFCNLTPDATIFLKMDGQVALERSLSRLTEADVKEGRFEAKGTEFHSEVCRRFQEQCDARPEWEAIDANGTIEEVGSRILSAVLSHPKFPSQPVKKAG
jgi:dTMP kinase